MYTSSARGALRKALFTSATCTAHPCTALRASSDLMVPHLATLGVCLIKVQAMDLSEPPSHKPGLEPDYPALAVPLVPKQPLGVYGVHAIWQVNWLLVPSPKPLVSSQLIPKQLLSTSWTVLQPGGRHFCRFLLAAGRFES